MRVILASLKHEQGSQYDLYSTRNKEQQSLYCRNAIDPLMARVERVSGLISAVVVFLVVSSLLPLDPAAVQAEEKKPITPEDRYQLRMPSNPAISPNGEWVAYWVIQMYEEGLLFHVGIASCDGKFEWLSPGPLDIGYPLPSWSPDSKKLSYLSKGEISIIELDKENINVEHRGIKGSSTQWSPDGQFISFLSDGQIHLLDLNTNETRQITSLNSSVSSYIWSPVDNRIAFSDNNNLYLWEENKIG